MTLTLQYTGNQQYQLDAVQAVVDLFQNQHFTSTSFTAQSSRDMTPEEEQAYREALRNANGTPKAHQNSFDDQQLTIGYANNIRLSALNLKNNLHAVQEAHNLPLTNVMTNGQLRDFSIEMETGTGKTYVYIRTIYELNKQYGLTKFIIVVPSVAIREGVRKTFESTKEHFNTLYDGTPLDYFVYDPKNMGEVESFATSSSIEVMIINIGAFNKSFDKDGEEDKSNLFHRSSEKLPEGRSPREMVAECYPMVIIDEPQSVDNTVKAKKAIASLNPLFVLRYSATLKEEYNKIYSLTPVEAFQQNLVKGICVDSVQAEEDLNGAYIRLDSVHEKQSSYSAKLTIDVMQKDGGQKRKKVTVKTGTNLYDVSKENPDYRNGWTVDKIDTAPGFESVLFSNDTYLEVGQVQGNPAAEAVKRAQIRQTIDDHFQKQLEMQPQGVKVLSLFFIDEVAKYREYEEDSGNNGETIIKDGEYARMFDEEYTSLITSPRWRSRFEKARIKVPQNPEAVRTAYFAQDRKTKRYKDSTGTASTEADTDTFELIMRDKETLLSLPDGQDPRKNYSFIFSHSALKEGWDNPNVFQICTLVETKDTMTKRQKIGRGLRLCVNQEGKRLHDPQANTLTVIANESYINFAKSLQKEFEQAGFRFGVLTPEALSGIDMSHGEGIQPRPFGTENSTTVYKYLQEKDLVDKNGKITPELKEAAEDHTLQLPEEYQEVKGDIENIIIERAQQIPIRNKRDEISIELNEEAFHSEAFKELWKRIRPRSTYQVEIDDDALIDYAVNQIEKMDEIDEPKIYSMHSDLEIDMGGVSISNEHESIMNVQRTYSYKLEDPISRLQDIVGLTRASLKRILEQSGCLDQYPKNPNLFIVQVAEAINQAKTKVLAKGITYDLLPEDEWYSDQIFIPHDRKGYPGQNVFQPSHLEKWLYNDVVFDSSKVEEPYAEKLDRQDGVLFCTKLPPTFTIDTPFGPYNPDWAIVRENDDGSAHVYLVVETKGGDKGQAHTTPHEDAKIECAKAHFALIKTRYNYSDNDFKYVVHAVSRSKPKFDK